MEKIKIVINQEFDFDKRFSPKRKKEFAAILMDIQSRMRIKATARGWAYLLEQNGYINKGQFDRVGDAINDLRKQGVIPVDFVAEDEGRPFYGVDKENKWTIDGLIRSNIEDVLGGHYHYNADYWADEEYYIQCIVEKVDVRNLFQPVCEEFHIPFANVKGWSSVSNRAEFCRRFKEAEDDGKQCVLLYCGDHDPDGLRISDTLRKNLDDIKDITWADGTQGYDPRNLIIDRFGLEYDFIIENGFTWIDNLITGGKKNGKSLDLSNPNHPNHNLQYLQDYLKKVGARKCEANVLITNPILAEALIRDAIGKYVDAVALKKRYEEKEEAIRKEYNERIDEMEVHIADVIDENTGTVTLRDLINSAIDSIK